MIGFSLRNPGFLGALAGSGASVTMATLGSITVGSNVVDIPGMYTIYTYGYYTYGTNPINYVGSTSSAAIIEAVCTVSDYGGNLTRGTRIKLSQGTWSVDNELYVDTNGLINGDYITPRTFTIGGVTATLEPSFLGDTWGYADNATNTDLFNLQARNGQSLTLKAENTVNVWSTDIQGVLGIGYSEMAGYGYSPGIPMMYIQPWGSMSATPTGIVASMLYNTNNIATQIQLTAGNYSGQRGSLGVTNAFTVNGSTNYIVRIGNYVRPMMGYSGFIQIQNDPFNLASYNGQNVSFEIMVI